MLSALVFPASQLETTCLRAYAAMRGERVFTASAAAADGVVQFPDTHTILPRIDDADFVAQLLALLREKNIDIVYCPHDRCFALLDMVLREAGLAVRLCNGLPHYTTSSIHADLLTMLQPLYAAHRQRIDQQPSFSPDHLAAYLRLAAQLPGQSHFHKLATMGIISGGLPVGDWVEIGVAAGRSTLFLALLAQHFGLGPLIAIDPLDMAEARQHIAVLDEAIQPRDHDPRRSFTLNLLPYARGQLAFLPVPATQAAAQYQAKRYLGEAPFGAIRTHGQIALLHIDGNHELSKVQADLALWTPYLVPNAWLVVDDYVWHYGNGPKLATDAWLADNQARVAEQWVADRAMFIRIKSG